MHPPAWLPMICSGPLAGVSGAPATTNAVIAKRPIRLAWLPVTQAIADDGDEIARLAECRVVFLRFNPAPRRQARAISIFRPAPVGEAALH
jgi:hypothetical protein